MSNNRQYTVNHSDRDGTSFKLPGDDPGEQAFEVQPDTTEHWRWYVHVKNGWDQNADFTVEGSHFQDGLTNDTLDAPVEDGTAETINSDANGAFNGATGHSYLQLNVAPAGDPTSGDLVVTFQRRQAD